MDRTIVVALGGNAILRPGQRGTAEEQRDNVRATAESIARMLEDGCRVVITHGNGPQVGSILLQNEEAQTQVPAMPLDICGAESQGLIGYLIQQAISNELARRGIKRPVVSLVTQVVVEREDPAFMNPTKPIGPFYSRERAEEIMREKGLLLKEDAGRGWRRVVPSPDPKSIWEINAVKYLVDAGAVVIASGGGGIPVIRREDGTLEGVEAVIDKDLAGERLAKELGAELFLILTDVERAALNFGQPDQVWLERLTAAEAQRYLDEGHFKPGSMGPKVMAATRFICHGGKAAVITSLGTLCEALAGKTGTWIVP